ncbi:Crp/Fnr family transcriptional regulator [Hymenobacter sp. RP-2-7]|uniref:Crp/Fnr family transcriptional regulator n=1 Tax=Hymenobacter polaris TaxID=2682546 RepID=A0A7Y0FM70_9BACT|nr:cyclic nucleotide-binding domain-containing protein [Hymenobacter polaris]NML65548.1 Crp/Fnr family transcriptional regulator [Hymenobacter polaris]
MSASLLACLRAFGPIPLADEAPLLAAWHPRPAGEGEWLTAPNTVCEELFFVVQGVLRITDGTGPRETTHAFRTQGQLCTLLASFERQEPSPLRIQAACPAQVLAISHARLAALSQQLPYLPALLQRLIQHELLAKLTLQRAYLGQDAAARYRTLLARQPEVARQVPQRMLASYLGITPQSLSRLRRAG